MVGQHIPTVLVIFSVLAAYRIFGIGDLIYKITHKELQTKYDYIISKLAASHSSVHSWLSLTELDRCVFNSVSD